MKTGKVYLVGAGPGDPDLITVRGRALIGACDALVYDRLTSPEMLTWARPDCELRHVGKSPGVHSIEQDAIAEILIELAKQGKSVVRLKGGDPFIYGRGGEEAFRLHQAGIPFEIIPAVTAALGAAAYVGIPLTHREHSSSLVFLSGHEDPEKEDRTDWRAYAKLDATLCLYMAMGRLAWIAAELIEGGRSPQTPVTVVEWATTPRQRECAGVLGNIADTVAKNGLGAPAIVIVGSVAVFSQTLSWFKPCAPIE